MKKEMVMMMKVAHTLHAIAIVTLMCGTLYGIIYFMRCIYITFAHGMYLIQIYKPIIV